MSYPPVSPPPSGEYYNQTPPPEKKNKNWLIPAIAGGLVLLLVLCGLGGWLVYKALDKDPVPVPTATGPANPPPTGPATLPPNQPPVSSAPPVTDPPTDNPGGSKEEQFVAKVQERPYFQNTSGTSLVKLGNSICGAFDRGSSFQEVGKVLVNNSIPAYDAGWLIGASVVYLCPKHQDKIPSN